MKKFYYAYIREDGVNLRNYYLIFLIFLILLIFPTCNIVRAADLSIREWSLNLTSDGLAGWNLNADAWKVSKNLLLGDFITGKAIAYRDESYRDVEIECSIKIVAGRAGILFDIQNILNYYELALEKDKMYLILQKTSDKRYLSSVNIPRLESYKIKIIQRGSRIKILLNEMVMIDIEDQTFTDGKVGLMVYKGKAYFSDLSIKGAPPLVLKNNEMEVLLDGKSGNIKSLLGFLNDDGVQFCDSTIIDKDNPWWWGTVLLDYGKGLISSNNMKSVTTTKDSSIVTRYGDESIELVVERDLRDKFLEETYTLSSRNDLTVNTLGVVFRPTITMHVGEHLSYFFVENTPTTYHWFTGKDLAYLLITHNNGRAPHLAIVLTKGEINGYTPLYNLGVRHNPLSSSPVLFVTGYGIDNRNHEYKQSQIHLDPDKPLSFTLRYFLFEDQEDLEKKLIEICKQPVFHYPRYIPAGKKLSIEVRLPQGLEINNVNFKGTILPFVKIGADLYRIETLVEDTGLHRINFRLSNNKETFILFECIHNLRDLIDKRAETIIKFQFNEDVNSPGFCGIFPIDLQTKKSMLSPDVGNCQQAGTGEITASALIVLYKNIVNPNIEEIKKIELYTNKWLREKCQDENYACYLNPLNKIIGGDGMGFRIWNANWLSTIYYYLSLIEDRYLTLQTRDTYLLWAYDTLKWFFSNKPTYISPEPHMIRKIINELYARDYNNEARELEQMMKVTIENIISQAQEISKKDREWVMDQNAFIPNSTFLFIEGYKEADVFFEPAVIDLGYSYDPRVQSAFRIWDDAASGYYYKLIPYPTMPHFWTSIVGYPLLLAYEKYHKEEFLEAAYNSIMSLYESYNYDYQFNLWGKMELGEAHAAFLPGLGMNTQERACSDQDGGFSTYLETFATKCYITKTGRAVNCDRENNRIVSWAAYPREYILEDTGYKIYTTNMSAIINFIETKEESILIELENLRKDEVNTELRVTSMDGRVIRSKTLTLKPMKRQILNIKLRK